MGSETVGTLVITAILVAVLAGYVTLVGLGLRRLSFTLGTIVVGLRAIRMQTQPVGEVLGGVLEDVTGIDDDLGEVVAAVGEELGPAPAGPPPVREPAIVYDEVEAEDDVEAEAEPLVRLNIRPQVRVPARR